MADYYYDSSSRRAPKRSRRGLGATLRFLLNALMILLTLVCFGAMVVVILASHFDPSRSWIFPVAGLFSPAIYITSLLLALCWIVRWRWRYASLLLLPLVISAPAANNYLRIESSKKYGEPSRRGAVTLLSYNVKGFINDDKKHSTDEVIDFIEEVRPDVVCLQEYNKKNIAKGKVSPLLSRYHKVECTKDQGEVIYSRYEIIDSSVELLDDELYKSGSAIWADLLVGEDTLRIYNLHLHSTAITSKDNEYINNLSFLNETDSLESDTGIKNMLIRFKESAQNRASQADTIAESIAVTPHRKVVCGDFNDTPNSYTLRRISSSLKDTFREVGNGYPYTFRGFMNLLRIDYILVDEPTEVVDFRVIDSVLYSDHLPIVATFKL